MEDLNELKRIRNSWMLVDVYDVGRDRLYAKGKCKANDVLNEGNAKVSVPLLNCDSKMG